MAINDYYAPASYNARPGEGIDPLSNQDVVLSNTFDERGGTYDRGTYDKAFNSPAPQRQAWAPDNAADLMTPLPASPKSTAEIMPFTSSVLKPPYGFGTGAGSSGTSGTSGAIPANDTLTEWLKKRVSPLLRGMVKGTLGQGIGGGL